MVNKKPRNHLVPGSLITALAAGADDDEPRTAFPQEEEGNPEVARGKPSQHRTPLSLRGINVGIVSAKRKAFSIFAHSCCRQPGAAVDSTPIYPFFSGEP